MAAAIHHCKTEKKTLHKKYFALHIQTLKEKLSAKNKFIGIITHEIRNFVTNIVTNASLLKETKVYNQELVTELLQASSFLSEILNNTLDISKLEEGKIEFNLSFESAKSTIDIVLNIYKTNADKKCIMLDTLYGPKLPEHIEFDKSRFTQIIMNLVSNAIKFTPEHGKVCVKLDWNPAPGENYILHPKKIMVPPLKLSALPPPKHKHSISESGSESPIERIPDEITPTHGSGINRLPTGKIPRKVKAHSFIARMKRHVSGSVGPVRNEKVATGSERCSTETLGPAPLSSSITAAPDSESANSNSNSKERLPARKLRKLGKNLSTFCIFTKELPDIEEKKVILPPVPPPRKIKLNLRDIPKDFTMSQRHFFPAPITRAMTPQKQREPAKSVSSSESTPLQSPEPPRIIPGTLILQVIDTGCGMTESEKARLFQPFSQTNKKVYGKFGGTGLGLWLCQKLVQAMSGTISCETSVGTGTTFTVAVPAKAKVGGPEQPPSQGETGFKGFAVLCCFKDPQAVQRVLRKLGCKVSIFVTFDEFLAALRENRNQRVKRQAVIVGMRGAKRLREAGKKESLGLKISQIVVITGMSLRFLGFCEGDIK